MSHKIFALLVAALFLYVASPLLLPVVMGAVLAVLFFPALEKLEQNKISTSLGSAILTVTITLVILIPTALLIFFGAKTGAQQIQAWKQTPLNGRSWLEAILNSPRIHRVVDSVTHWFPVTQEELIEGTQDLVRSIGVRIADLLGQLVTHLPGMLVAVGVIVVTVYFFLIDGRRLVLFFRRNSVLSADQTEVLIKTLGGMCRSVILASIVSGLSQSILETVLLLVTGTPNVAFIALLIFLFSFIPVVGAAPITFGVAIQQLFLDRTGVGIVLLVTAAVVVVLDNMIRPIFLKGSANLHPLLAFVAAFGGLQTLGFLGVFLGPIIAALFMATIEILVSKPPEKATAKGP